MGISQMIKVVWILQLLNWSTASWRFVPANYLSRNPNHEPSQESIHGFDDRSEDFPIELNPKPSIEDTFQALDWRWKTLRIHLCCSPTVNRSHLISCWILCEYFCDGKCRNIVKRNVVKQKWRHLERMIPIQEGEFIGGGSTDETIAGSSWSNGGPRLRSIIHCRYVPWESLQARPPIWRLIWRNHNAAEKRIESACFALGEESGE